MPVSLSVVFAPLAAAAALAAPARHSISTDGIIQPGDRIHLVCAEEPSLDRDYRVTPQGVILVDFLGSVKVAGMSKTDAAKSISSQLVSSHVLHTADIKVDEAAASSTGATPDSLTSVHWSGQVDNPGYVAYHPGLSLADVWPSIHPSSTADISVIQIINPKLTPRNISISPTTDLSQIPLQAEDEIIFVQKLAPLSKVYVGGEVVSPGNYDVTSTSTVGDLIREAGGPTSYADADNAQLIHGNADPKPLKTSDTGFHPGEGDKVMVLRRAPDMMIPITGGVKKPGTLGFWNGAKLSEAIDKAGGFTNGGDKAHIRIIYADNPKGILVDYGQIQNGYVGDLALKPGMRIEIPTSKRTDGGETVRYAAGAAVLIWLLGK